MDEKQIKSLEQMICDEYRNIAGIVVLKEGETQYEKYFNECTAESCIHIYSVTKSIISILIGIAIDKGYIKSVKQNVLEFFPEYITKRGEKTIRNITLENMLTMTAPYKYKINPYIKYFTSDDWVKFSLDLLGGKGRIGEFKYAPLIGPDILSGILVKATGQSVFDFAQANLFSPLGIVVEKNVCFDSKEEQLAFNKATNISGWAVDSTGLNAAGWGLTLSAMDMAKIGQLYIAHGMWNGKQIVSSKWIEESTREHSRFKKQDMPYGYLWWIINKEEHVYAAMGDGGNIIYVDEATKMVISIASLFEPRAKDRIEFIQKYLEPICTIQTKNA